MCDMSETQFTDSNENGPAPITGNGAGNNFVLRVRDITVGFGDHLVLDGLDLDVNRGEILGFVGASGTGKSVLMRTVLGLNPRIRGSVEVFGIDIDSASRAERSTIEQRWGVLFQQGA